MASNVMEHLELMKEKEDRKRAVNMNMCLAAFVDPEHQLRKRKRKITHQRSRSLRHATFAEHKAARSVRGEEETESITSPKLPTAPRSTKSSGRRSNASRKREEPESMESGDDSETETSSRVGDDDHVETFERASKGLFESLSLRNGGGVVFMSTTAGLRPDGTPMPSVKPSMDDMKETAAQHRDSVGGMTEQSFENPPAFADSGHSVELLAHVESPTTNDDDQGASRQSFMPLPPGDLAKLIKRHPRGKLYSFGDDGLSQGSSGEESLSADFYSIPANARRRLPSKSEAAILAKHFPGARQVIFVPLWDVQIESWVACFAYNTSDFRTFSHNPDFLHSIAFCSCVMTEVARLATIVADQQKSDFIGSISHELRSPLHGILASCEFLEDTECSSYQKALVSTADSCARTLLDTINMVLDYSKINSFERNIRKARKNRKEMTPNTVHPIIQQPSLNIYDAIDLAAITEEVVAGVALGHVFRDITTFEGQDDRVLLPSPNRNLGELGDGTPAAVKRPEVEIIMNLEARRWDFVTQPGAFRRIVMNLFGNAIKYTKQGFIQVSLTAKDIKDPPLQRRDTNQDPPATSIVTLTISDSGQGISPEYLRTKLFTPFAQESPLNPGTGLGLSLVRSIVDMLNGEINVRSALGVGTEVVVTLPMVKGGSSGTNSTTTPASAPISSSSGSIERPILNSVNHVKEMATGMTAALFKSSDLDSLTNPVTTRALDIARESLECFLTDWYGFARIEDWHPETKTDLIAVDEVDLPKLIQACPSLNSNLADGPMLIVVRASATRHTVTDELMKHVHLEYLSRPVGPYKLARALQNVFERRAKKNSGSVADSAVSPDPRGDLAIDEMVTHVEQITLETGTEQPETINVLHQGDILGNEDSMNAHMAMDTLPPPDAVPPVEQNEEFPFPDPSTAQADDGAISPSFVPSHDRPPFEHSRTMSWTPQERLLYEAPPASPMSAQGVAMNSAPNRKSSVSAASATTASSRDASTTPTPKRLSLAQPPPPARTPRLLLVDDNAVNLRLLQTFMRKRSYTAIHSAADGAQAVQLFSSLLADAHPPDIVFMDISMPTMNGFEATRRIRAIEADFGAGRPPHERPPPSLIVALTGLASGRDQSEAFTSGFDLYMTKPVSFREVGRLLDNWVANGGAGEGRDSGGGAGGGGGADGVGAVPFGPVVGEVS